MGQAGLKLLVPLREVYMLRLWAHVNNRVPSTCQDYGHTANNGVPSTCRDYGHTANRVSLLILKVIPK